MANQMTVGDLVTWMPQSRPGRNLIPIVIRGCVVVELVSESMARIKVGARECTALLSDLQVELDHA